MPRREVVIMRYTLPHVENWSLQPSSGKDGSLAKINLNFANSLLQRKRPNGYRSCSLPNVEISPTAGQACGSACVFCRLQGGGVSLVYESECFDFTHVQLLFTWNPSSRWPSVFSFEYLLKERRRTCSTSKFDSPRMIFNFK